MRRPRRRSHVPTTPRWAPVALMALALALPAPAAGETSDVDPLRASIDENQTKLSRLRAQIKQQQVLIDGIADEEAEVQRSREQIEQEIELTQQLMGQMLQKELMLREQSRRMKSELNVRKSVYDARRRALARSLRAMYLRQQRGDLEMLVTAGSFSDLMARVKLGRLLARLEAGLLEQTRHDGTKLLSEQRQLDAALAEIWQTREDVDDEAERLQGLLAELAASLQELETRRRGVKNRLVELNLNEQKLNYVLEDLEQQRAQRGLEEQDDPESLARLAGDLEWPVRGEMLRGFGRSVHPRFQTVTLNNGVNIAAPRGSPVAAVAKAVVEFADELPGFGQCVILDHGSGYYTLYAHLDRLFVAEGDQIARGQVVAEVGRPSRDEDPQLYFEVRHGRTPLDPTDWLRSR